MTAVAELLHTLLGCSWGHVVSTPDDLEPCDQDAVQIVIVHDGPWSKDLRLCQRHVDRLALETTSRAES
jgi:hypothetical protein